MMPYEAHVWINDELITAEKLNHLEQGVQKKETFVGYNKRETDLKYANVLIGSASGTTQVTVNDARDAPIPGLEIAGKSEQGADPSPDNPQEIVSTDVTAVTVTGANLFDTSALTAYNVVSSKVSSDKRQITVTGNKNNAFCYYIIPVQLIAGKTVTISGSISNGNQDVPVGIQIQTIQPDNKSRYFHLSSSGSRKFSIAENIVKASFILFANNTNTVLDTPNTVTYSDVMINIGDTALPWEPYQSKTAAIALTEPLRGIGDVRDRIICRDGVWGVERAINQIDDTGTVPISEALEVLAVPTWEPLPSDTQAALNALTAYKGRTTITVTAEGPEPDVAVEYIADTKTYIANEHAKMQASFDRQISAILALLPTETQAAMINNETSALLAESEV